MIGLIMIGSVINYLTRSAFAVAAPTLLKDLNIGAQQYSWIVGTFQGAIMLALWMPLRRCVESLAPGIGASISSTRAARHSRLVPG
jgi:hypothetical protein